jgi:hypothetical protein
MKHIVKHIKYPKIELYIFGIILAYVLFALTPMGTYISTVKSWGYLGVFIAGILYSFGFTSPIGIALFILIPLNNIYLPILVAGVASVLPDLLIYNVAKTTLNDEIEKFEKTKYIKEIERWIEMRTTKKIRRIFSYILAFAFIGSPLPDEVGVTMLTEMNEIHERLIVLISLIAHTFFIALIILASH